MTKKGQHGEPWHAVTKPSPFGPMVTDITRYSGAEMVLYADSDRGGPYLNVTLKDGKRIVECVNALDGWDIEEARRALAEVGMLRFRIQKMLERGDWKTAAEKKKQRETGVDE